MQTEENKAKQSERMKRYHAEKKALNNNVSETQKSEPVEIPVNLTPDEKAIFQRVSSEDTSWLTLDDQDVDDYTLSADPFDLPEPAKKLRDSGEFSFRWVTRSAARLDELKNKPDIFKWWVVNRSQPRARIFDSFIDPNNGCVSREDQMLVFKPRWLFDKEQMFKNKIADGRTASANLDSKRDEKGSAELVGSNTVNKERLKVNSGDVEFAGEADVDRAMGISTPLVSESDMTVME